MSIRFVKQSANSSSPRMTQRERGTAFTDARLAEAPHSKRRRPWPPPLRGGSWSRWLTAAIGVTVAVAVRARHRAHGLAVVVAVGVGLRLVVRVVVDLVLVGFVLVAVNGFVVVVIDV